MTPNSSGAISKLDELSAVELVERVSKLLPEQAPLNAFVHHNTLHAFEDLHFLDAVERASTVLGGEPYLSEEHYAQCLREGRISLEDIEAVLKDTCGEEDYCPLFDGGPSRYELKFARLMHYIQPKSSSAVLWSIQEQGLTKNFISEEARDLYRDDTQVLAKLWYHLQQTKEPVSKMRLSVRVRDLLWTLCGRDSDRYVHPFLIRFTAAFLDQGIGYWKIPFEGQNFFDAFVELYSKALYLNAPWQKGLKQRLSEIRAQRLSSAEVIEQVLSRLQGEHLKRYEFLLDTLLSLRGWAGMMRQAELRPDRMPCHAPPARLIDYAAIQLLLDECATNFIMNEEFGRLLSHSELRERFLKGEHSEGDYTNKENLSLQHEAYCTAQLCGVQPDSIRSPRAAQVFVSEVAAFGAIARRRLLHLAYEHHHRCEVLDGLLTHYRLGAPKEVRTDFQAVFCIDDREESLRRHLEEVAPCSQTYGYAGFFGVAMSYQGLDDIHATPLCPVAITPQHLVREVSCEDSFYAKYKKKKRLLAAQTYAVFVGSKTLVRGTLVSQVLGLLAFLPLVLRCVAPRTYRGLVHLLGRAVLQMPKTKLLLERSPEDGKRDGYFHGYTIEEMSGIVRQMLTAIGLTKEFSPIVIVAGHGSCSLNNPHKAAYDCGATGGGKGGPNARAFALMANHPEVRKVLKHGGIEIPETTWFVGACHNTGDDSMAYYDEDRIPEALIRSFEAIQTSLLQACMLDAHERCRRFKLAPAKMTARRALKHVEQRANDLAQPRPEYGHATNAICLVGRRRTTRGLFLDRRAFLVSYDPDQDETGAILAGLLLSVGPVGAGINLEYYFSTVDPLKYGAGSKLPHNVTGLLGVMDGHASDLRTGLPRQMVEIHEPVRLLTIVEREPETLIEILEKHKGLGDLIGNGWIQLVSLSPKTGAIEIFQRGQFVPYCGHRENMPCVSSSLEYYESHLEHLPCAHIEHHPS
ncbi:MAG: DUF2309 domain-containing protein [Bdellovibrionales bacterium]|nr:DUF2309 domain-containing protein [Bdellovibrionales bacterium]